MAWQILTALGTATLVSLSAAGMAAAFPGGDAPSPSEAAEAVGDFAGDVADAVSDAASDVADAVADAADDWSGTRSDTAEERAAEAEEALGDDPTFDDVQAYASAQREDVLNGEK